MNSPQPFFFKPWRLAWANVAMAASSTDFLPAE
jgi:hypothetical protein